MGANVWQRDSTGSGTSFKVGPAPPQYPARPGKRKLVWTKGQQDQPATPAVSVPGLQRASEGPSTSYSQPDHFEKRARLNGSYAENGYHHGCESHASNRSNGARQHVADKRQQQTSSASASKNPAAVQAQQQKAAELAELKRRIQQQEAQLLQQKVHSKVRRPGIDAQLSVVFATQVGPPHCIFSMACKSPS